MSNEVKMSFNTVEEAVIFAEKKGYQYEVIQTKEAKVPKKSYANNFG